MSPQTYRDLFEIDIFENVIKFIPLYMYTKV